MASVKIVLAKHKVLENGEHPLWLRIIKDRKTSYKALGYSCRLEWWDSKNNKPSKKHPNRHEVEILLNKKLANVSKFIMEAEIEDKEFSASEIAEKSKNKSNKTSVFEYFDIVILRLKAANRIGNSQAIKDALSALKRYRDQKDLSFTQLDVNQLNRLEEYLLGLGIAEISISAYMRSIRNVYNRAITEGVVKKELYPFDKYKISKLSVATKKRSITKDQIKQIIDLEVEQESLLWHSKNYFLFSYYCMGINLIDIASLTRANVENGRLRYKRQKTGKEYNIKLLAPAITILDHYMNNQISNYVFPIFNDKVHISAQQKKDRIHKVTKQVNKNLKTIASLSKININLTTYVARHSFATVLKQSGVSTSVISEAMKHDSEKTTQIYLDSFANDVLDEANERLLE